MTDSRQTKHSAPCVFARKLRTRHGGNCGTTPFYLFEGQDDPEYDQGDFVIVWYDDLHDLAVRAAKGDKKDG